MTKGTVRYLAFNNSAEWRAWLEEYHAVEREAWLLHYKKKAAKQTLTYEQAVEEALCFGWIDGLLRRVDNEKYALRYSPRKSRSIWSQSNKQRVEKLISEGRMAAAGLEKVIAAKVNGEWEAATTREDIDAFPSDLAQELRKNRSWAAFKEWPPTRKKQYLYWLNSAKRSETRKKRIRAIVEMVKTEK